MGSVVPTRASPGWERVVWSQGRLFSAVMPVTYVWEQTPALVPSCKLQKLEYGLHQNSTHPAFFQSPQLLANFVSCLANWRSLVLEVHDSKLFNQGLASWSNLLQWCLPSGSESWRVRLQCSRPGFDPWIRKIPWRRKWQPSPVFLPGKSHGQSSLVSKSWIDSATNTCTF